MVRVNLVDAKKLADQHLIAEYDEILMLIGYIQKHPSIEDIPQRYCLGKGHMRFFKDKVLYLKKRHEHIKDEMRRRGFQTNKTIDVTNFKSSNKQDWKPKKEDIEIITKRIVSKLRLKPNYYRYHRDYRGADFLVKLLTR